MTCRLQIILILDVVGTLLTNIGLQYFILLPHWCGLSCVMVMRRDTFLALLAYPDLNKFIAFYSGYIFFAHQCSLYLKLLIKISFTVLFILVSLVCAEKCIGIKILWFIDQLLSCSMLLVTQGNLYGSLVVWASLLIQVLGGSHL